MGKFKLILMLIYAVKAFEAFDTDLELTHSSAMDFIDNGALGCARSLIPDSLCVVAKMMEETFLKFPKGSG